MICYMPLKHGIKHDIEVMGLYSEWSGIPPISDKEMVINLTTVVARLGDYYKGRIVGSAQLIMIYDYVWDMYFGLIENVFVSEEYREKGIAKGLMKELEVIAKNKGCVFLKLTSSLEKEAGHALYRSLGYIEGRSFKKWLQ